MRGSPHPVGKGFVRLGRRWACRWAPALALLGLVGALAASALAATPLVRHPVPGLGFSIGVPAGWKAVDYREVAASGVFERLAKENPSLAQVFQAIRDPRSGIRFLAADPHTTNGFATNVNVVVEKVPRGVTARVYADAAARQLAALPNVIRPIRTETTQLPAGASARLRYGIRFKVAGKQLVVATTQYALVRRTQAFIVTYTTIPVLSAKLTPVFRASARSIRLAP